MATFPQEYAAPIERLYNIHQLMLADDLGLRSASATHLPAEVTVIATLIDRDPQYEALINFLEDRLEHPECHRPTLIVLHGCDTELHRAFVLRCERLDIPELLGANEVCLPFGRVKWPEGSARIESILRSLGTCFSLPRLVKQAQIEAKLQDLAHSLCFSHHIDASAWESATEALIDEWITYMRARWPELPSGRLVVAFLCIELPAQKTSRSEAARAYIEALHRRYASDPCLLITKELQPIRKIHVGDWIAEARRYLGEQWDEAIIVDAPTRLFPQGQDARPLAELFHDLMDLLREAYRPSHGRRPIFGE